MTVVKYSVILCPLKRWLKNCSQIEVFKRNFKSLQDMPQKPHGARLPQQTLPGGFGHRLGLATAERLVGGTEWPPPHPPWFSHGEAFVTVLLRSFLHAGRIIHRCIQPESCILDNQRLGQISNGVGKVVFDSIDQVRIFQGSCC